MSQQQSLSSFGCTGENRRIDDKETDDKTSLRQYEGPHDADTQGLTAVIRNMCNSRLTADIIDS